jgi:methionyl-tRNA formyltransferase
MQRLRLIFFGTAELACASLEALAAQPEYLIVAVVTQPDRPRGRSLQMQPSAVKASALRLSLPVLQPERARETSFISELEALSSHLIVVAAYGQILPQRILDLPLHGALNVHTSLLPKYRGAAPIQWAILDNQAETGVTIMKMDAGLDTGPMLSQEKTPILENDNGQTLHDRLALIGAELLLRTIPGYIDGTIAPIAQPGEGLSYARKISKNDGLIDWNKPARSLFNQIRALTPWPGSFTYLNDPQRLLKIWRVGIGPFEGGSPGTILASDRGSLVVSCSDGSLRIEELQIEGGKRLSVRQFLAGHPIPIGTKLGSIAS